MRGSTVLLLLLAAFHSATAIVEIVPRMSAERVVFQIDEGEIEFGFYPEVAPVTCAHIFELVQLGLFTTNEFFRVDKGFVAQATKNVPLEVVEGVKHHTGVLSMGRFDDPNSGQSSFSMLLGDAPHLDMQYTLFGKVTKGMDVLHKLEALPTKTEGIFVMPLKRIEIRSTYWYRTSGSLHLSGVGTEGSGDCEVELETYKSRFASQSEELQRVRKKCLPA
eukprot:gene31049-7142_t